MKNTLIKMHIKNFSVQVNPMVNLNKFQLNTAITYLGILTNTFTGWSNVENFVS